MYLCSFEKGTEMTNMFCSMYAADELQHAVIHYYVHLIHSLQTFLV
jgi:hypothetical protein